MKLAIKLLLILAPVSVFTPSVTTAADNEFSVVAGGNISYKYLEFGVTELVIKPSLITFDLSFTGVYKSFYAAVNYDNTIKEDYYYLYQPAPSNDDVIMTLSREDAGLTLGYNFANSITLFGGYLDGTTTAYLQGNLLAIDFVGPPFDPDNRFNSIIKFIMKGPFLGVGYSLPMGSKNTLSMNIAYADMDGSVEIDNGVSTVEATGDATGFSYGLGIAGPLTESMSYRIGLKANRYTFDHTSYIGQGAPVPDNDDFTSDQNFNIFYIGVSSYL